MAIRTRTFRVFVSSTFSDLKAERDALQRKAKPGEAHHEVFPKLRKLCEEHGARFQAIDLRWGVRDEAALDQKTMEICLREIERCQKTGIKPNFIVLLGQRYGWRPLPARIEAREFQAVCNHFASPWGLPFAEAFYARDDNAVPPEYRLKPLTGKWMYRQRWDVLETCFHSILLTAAKAAGLTKPALVKYWASATEQEIRKGLGTTNEDLSHVFAFCRDVPDPDKNGGPDLVTLKRFLSDQLPAGNVHSYAPDNLEGLCEDVERTLRAVIESEAAGFESLPALSLETEAHDTFAQERALVFGRDEVLDTITEYVRAGGESALVLQGASGSGKSAVMAQASERAPAALPAAVVVRRFIGASPESSSGLTLLRSIAEQIGEAYGAAGELPADFDGVVRVFRERMGLATAARPLVVFIDALDQLGKDDPAGPLAWLGGALPAHCRIVVSTTDDAPVPRGCELVPLGDLPPEAAAAALEFWLDASGRRLQPAQRDWLLAAFGRCRLPLYLKLAFEEARLWPSYQEADQCLLGEGVEGIIDTLLERLSQEANHGPVMVERSLGYLAAARFGLTEDEILDVLSKDQEVWNDFEAKRNKAHDPLEQRLPVVVWSRFFLDLEPYLTERSAPGGTVTSFYHRKLAEQAAARFLGGTQRQERHRALAGYFAAQPHWFDAGQSRPNARQASELVHHQLGARQLDEAGATLTDLQFVGAKCAADLVFDLQADYAATMAVLPEAQPELREEHRRRKRLERWTRELIEHARAWSVRRDRAASGLAPEGPEPELPEIPDSVEPWNEERIEAECERIRHAPERLDRVKALATFVQQQNSALREFGKRPGFVVQHAYNAAPAGSLHALAEAEVESVTAFMLLRQWSPRAAYNPMPALLRTLEGHTYEVTSVSVTPDGRRGVSASLERTLRVWDLETGKCLRILEGHGASVAGVSVTADGRRAVSGSWDKTLRVWDLEAGACLRTLEGHTDCVECVTMTADGRLAVSGSRDNMVRVWDLETGTCLRTLEGHSGWVKCVSMTPDGRRAVSGSGDKTLRLWDLETGACLRNWDANSTITSVSITPDGLRAASGSMKQTLRVWDLETGACLRTIEGRLWEASSMSVTPDGRRAVSGYQCNTPLLWDLETGACLRILEGHSRPVTTLSVTADGRRAVSGGQDRTLRVWDLETGAGMRAVEGHNISLSVTPDGRRAVTGSMDKTLRLWDLKRDICLRVMEGHSEYVKAVCVTPDGRRVVSGSKDKTVRIWDLETGVCLRILQGHEGCVESVSVAPDGLRAVSSSADKTLRVWDLETGACLRTLEGHDGGIASVNVTPDGRRAVSASIDATLRVWDLETGACLRILEGHRKRVTSVCVTPDGRQAVSNSVDHTLRVWDLQTGACLRTVTHGGNGGDVVVTPDGRWILGAALELRLRVWDLATGVRLQTAEQHTNIVETVGVTPDGKRAVSGSWDGTLRVWDLATGVCLRILEGHSSAVLSLSLTPDGRRVVSAGYDPALRVWDLETGACLRTLEGHKSGANIVVVTPDGRRAVSSGSIDKTLRVWDLETGTCLHTLEGHPLAVHRLSVTADGRRALSGSHDGTERVWDLETGACLHGEAVSTPDGRQTSTPDGRREVSGTWESTLRVRDLETGACLALARGNATWRALAFAGSNRLIAGSNTGEVAIFRMVESPAPGIRPPPPPAQLPRESVVPVPAADDDTQLASHLTAHEPAPEQPLPEDAPQPQPGDAAYLQAAGRRRQIDAQERREDEASGPSLRGPFARLFTGWRRKK